MSSALFQSMLFSEDGWNEWDMPKLKLKEIQFLCRMMNAPYSGTKEKLVIRLLTVWQVRKKLAPFDGEEGVAELVKAEPKENLKWMCKVNCLWRSGNKKQLSITLINWRNESRMKGQEFYKHQVELSKKAPHQLSLL